MNPQEAARVLQVAPDACRQVVVAAFGVLREMCLRDESDAAPRRLAELGLAHRVLQLAARNDTVNRSTR